MSDLVEPEGVNAGSALAERDRRPSGSVPASDRSPDDAGAPSPSELERGEHEEMVGAPGQAEGVPGQQLQVGEG